MDLNVGMLGFGTVGKGVWKILEENREEIYRRTKQNIRITDIAVKNSDTEKLSKEYRVNFTRDANSIINSDRTRIIIELIGGTDSAFSFIDGALDKGKHVITANKALLAEYGNQLFEKARLRGLNLGFEAAVGGGIPIIKTIREGLSGNKIQNICGIINGTTNYILSEMQLKGLGFNEALSRAQELGYAESDSSFDIEGIDAAHKICILAAISFGSNIKFKEVYTEGIDGIDLEDIGYAADLGYVIKPLAIARYREEGIELRVHPTLIPKGHLIANINGAMNGILINSNALGESLYYGKGAGAEPTASAVISDLVDISRQHNSVPALGFKELRDVATISRDDFQSKYYLRLRVKDESGVLADISRLLANFDVSVERLVQIPSNRMATLIIVTHLAREKGLLMSMEQIRRLNRVENDVAMLRLEEF